MNRIKVKKNNYAVIHKNKLNQLESKLEIAKLKQKERKIKKEILKTYLPSLSISKLNIKFSKLSVIISFVAIVIYTIFAVKLQFETSMEISSVLTASVFSFFGTELVTLSVIKKMKIKANKNESINSTIIYDSSEQYMEES